MQIKSIDTKYYIDTGPFSDTINWYYLESPIPKTKMDYVWHPSICMWTYAWHKMKLLKTLASFLVMLDLRVYVTSYT